MSVLKALLDLLRPYSWVPVTLVGLGVLASLSEGLGIGLLIPVLEVLIGSGAPAAGSGPVVDAVQRYAAAFPAEHRLPLVAATIVGLVAVKASIVYASGALFAWTSGRVGHDVRVAIFRQLLHVAYPFLTRHGPGRLINTLGSESWRVTDALGALFSLVTNACTIAVFSVLLLLISWPLAIGVGGGLLLASLVVRIVTLRSRRLGEAAVTANATLADRMVEALAAMRVIRAFGQERREAARFTEASERVRRTYLSLELTAGLVPPLLELLYAPILLGAFVLAWKAGVAVPALLAFAVLLYRIQPHVRSLDQNRVYLDALAGAVREVTWLLDTRDKPAATSGGRPFERLERGVTFRDVHLAYRDGSGESAALAGASFEIRSGLVTAVVGGSGAGKSTVVNLLLRLHDPDRGEILVDDRPLVDLDLDGWRARLGMAGQDCDLMSGTIAENIAYGRPGASRADVVEAARLADAHDFIAVLPEGYDTRVGERGLRLSGGQRQRIALARALARRPEVLVLDEATNAVDAASQHAIQRALERLRSTCTVVVIAHRLSTIRHADHVVVLSRGRVVEEGAPDQLITARGAFARLYAHEAAGQPRARARALGRQA